MPMLIEKRKISELNQAKYNPRIELSETDETFKKIEKSIEEFGYVEPIIVNKNNNVIVGGHQRVNVLKKNGYTEIECVIVDLDEKQEKKLNLALNKITGFWDNEKLKELFDELELSEEELFATGFDKYELENLNTDFISDLLEDDFSSVGKELDKFAVTFNIDIAYKEKFEAYFKVYGKDELIKVLIDTVEVKTNA